MNNGVGKETVFGVQLGLVLIYTCKEGDVLGFDPDCWDDALDLYEDPALPCMFERVWLIVEVQLIGLMDGKMIFHTNIPSEVRCHVQYYSRPPFHLLFHVRLPRR